MDTPFIKEGTFIKSTLIRLNSASTNVQSTQDPSRIKCWLLKFQMIVNLPCFQTWTYSFWWNSQTDLLVYWAQQTVVRSSLHSDTLIASQRLSFCKSLSTSIWSPSLTSFRAQTPAALNHDYVHNQSGFTMSFISRWSLSASCLEMNCCSRGSRSCTKPDFLIVSV